MKGQKQKENELRIESEHAKFVAKCIYEKAKEKSCQHMFGRKTVHEYVTLSDLASILDQLPEPEKQEYKSDNALRADGTGQLGELEKPLPVSRIASEPEKQPEVKGVDGYVAWHPVEGTAYTTMSRSRSFCEDRLLKSYFNFDSGSDVFAKADAYYAARDIELIRASNDGWKIRPVRLQFLDEPQDITAAEMLDEAKTSLVDYCRGDSFWNNDKDTVVYDFIKLLEQWLLKKRKV